MAKSRADLLQGTLDMLIMRALADEPLYGYALGLGPNMVLSVPDAIGIAIEECQRDRVVGMQQELIPAAETCSQAPKTDRRAFQATEISLDRKGDGPVIDAAVRSLLNATYLRPLRDAEKAMSCGRRSRRSQILQHTAEIATHGTDYDPKNPVDPQNPKCPLDLAIWQTIS